MSAEYLKKCSFQKVIAKNEFAKQGFVENSDIFFEYLCQNDPLFLNFSAIHLFYKTTQKTRITLSQNLLLNSTGDLNGMDQRRNC